MIYDIFLELPAVFLPKRVIKGCTLQLKLISIRNTILFDEYREGREPLKYDFHCLFILKNILIPTIRVILLYSFDLKIALRWL